MTNMKNIRELVQAFYSGETSLEDEKQLLDYFTGDNIDSELLSERDYFIKILQQEKAEIPKSLQGKVDDIFTRLEKNEKRGINIKRIMLWAGSAAAILIVLLLIKYSSGEDIIYNKQLAVVDTPSYNTPINMPSLVIDTIIVVNKYTAEENKETSPITKTEKKKSVTKTKAEEIHTEKLNKEDYKKMKEALELVSANINKGLEQMDLISESLSHTTEILNKKQN